MKVPYIKPTRNIHSSGYRMMEIGYVLDMDERNNVTKKQVIGIGCDAVHTWPMVGGGKSYSPNIDVTRDGYIRLFTHDGDLKWQSEEFVTSDMWLEKVESNE